MVRKREARDRYACGGRSREQAVRDGDLRRIMRTIIFLILTLMTSIAFAANSYELSFEVKTKGADKTVGKIRVKEGRVGSLSNNGTDIEVVAQEGEIQGRKGILMNFVVKKDNKILAKPQILTDESKQGQMTVNDKSGEILSLTVTANRISN